MARVFVSRRIPGPALERLCERHDTEVWPERRPPSYETLRKQAARADGLLTLLTDRIDAELLAAAPHLKAVANMAVGYNNIDLRAAAEHGVQVGNTPDVLTDATADLAWALLLAAARRLPEAIQNARTDWVTWEPAGFLGPSVAGATLGIIGSGRIGSAVARRAQGFDMQVITAGRGDDPGGLFERSDFISLHVPLTPETENLIDADALRRMKRSAILINTARGEVVDQRALADALAGGRIGGAALDVTTPEPLPPADPLWEAPNLIITPHIGSATYRAREQMTELAVENLLAALDGRPMPHRVTD
ncbi:MAG TPA: D-glycerate dehydrogenase [Solirubrobacteraceae bacterium]|nr:D-glycerate dehydrogenase [Solirubrobacteraceae bacterium]